MTSTRHAVFAVAALALTGLAAAHPAAAQTSITAVSYSSATLMQQPGVQFSLGYSFTTGANALNVTSLGFLNDGGTGANATHQLEIYQITGGTVLNPTSGTALFGTPVSVTTTGSSPLNNTFSYTMLTAPVLLSANTAYEIVGNSNANGYGIKAQNTVFSGITYGTSTYSSGQTTPVFNPNPFGSNDIGNFGPNFTANILPAAAAAPEPSQIAALGFAVLALAGLILKARRKTAIVAV